MVKYLLALLLSPVSPEFSAQVTGSGTVSRQPEVAFIPISVRSVCYANKEQESIDHYQVLEEVRAFVYGLSPDIYTFPVFPQKPQDFDRIPKPCPNISSRLTRVTLRTHDIENFYSYTFDQIQRDIPNRNRRQGDRSESPYTYTIVESPWADLYAETRKNLELEAKEKAVADAQKIIGSYAKGLAYVGEVQLIEINDPDQVFSNDQGSRTLVEKEYSNSMEKGFKNIEISTKVRFRFMFDGTSRTKFSAAPCAK